MEAAARLLEGGGTEVLTTNRIAERAGVSIGSLYQYFPNKEAVLVALLRRERAALLAEVEAVAAAPDTGTGRIDALISVALAHQFARPRLALELEYVERRLDTSAEEAELSERLATAILGILRAHAPGADRTAARDVVAICQALINAAAFAGDGDQAGLAARLRRAIDGYLA